MNAIIFGNGDFKNINNINKFVDLNDAVSIGVDGGCNYLLDNNIKIDIAIGDFDSVKDREVLNEVPSILKSDMSYSDFEMAIEYCIIKKFKKVYLYGCTGKRSDHFIFNFRLMERLYKNNIEAFMIDEYNLITLFSGKKSFYKKDFKFFSIIPVYENSVFSIEGYKYDLLNKELNLVNSLTLSNEWECDKVTINSNKLIFVCLVF